MLIDTHTHVNLEQFKDDSDAVIKKCLAQDIWLINVGTDAESSRRAIALAHEYPQGVYASVGLHPNDVNPDFDFSVLEKFAQDEKVVGIGETGLDYFRTPDAEKQKLQEEFFIKHIELSEKVKKPLIIHCRNAHENLLKLLQATSYKLPANPGVMHFFTGTKEEAARYIELGFYISFSGVITFAKEYEELVRWIPLDKILVETDAPYAAPAPMRGKRNEPSFVEYTARKIAELKNLPFQEVADQTTQNARKLFGI